MLQHFFGLVYLLVFSQLVSLTGTHADCPLQINPQSVVVRFGDPVSANCNTSVQHDGLGWESTVGAVPLSRDNLITWRVSSLTEWDIDTPFCYINLINDDQCEIALPVTVYKTPDRVSISTGTHTGPMTEGQQYELQCDVHNVAPVQSLTVRWYKGQTLVDQTSFNDTITTPVNKTTKLLINPDRAEDGVQYRCEAELNLGEEGPQPPPTVSSQPLSVNVLYKPKHSRSSEIVDIKGEVVLNCTVMANPAPKYSWHSKNLKEQISSSVLQSSTLRAGNYICTARNSLGEDSKVFILRSTGCRHTFWTALISFHLLIPLMIAI